MRSKNIVDSEKLPVSISEAENEDLVETASVKDTAESCEEDGEEAKCDEEVESVGDDGDEEE